MDRESSRASQARERAGDGRPPVGGRRPTDGDSLGGDHPLTGGDRLAGRVAPRLVINPRQDAGFVEACSLAMQAAPPVPRALQEALRSDYPQATVEPRALSGEPLRVWYVYRDGHWVSS